MYHQIGLQKLSHAQILKLLKGDRIRVKHGSHHNIHVSEEQHKKIHAAHKKGAGTTIQFDPFQQQMEAHHSLRSIEGKGLKETALRFLRKEVAPAAINFAAEQAKKAVSGEGVHKKARKTPVRKGKGFKEGALKFLRKEVLPVAIDFAAEQAKHAAVGEGMHHAHHSHHAHAHHAHAHHAHQAHGGALMPAGYGLKKRRGRPSKKGKGIGEDILHGIQEYGPSVAMSMLPLLL